MATDIFTYLRKRLILKFGPYLIVRVLKFGRRLTFGKKFVLVSRGLIFRGWITSWGAISVISISLMYKDAKKTAKQEIRHN